jgi:hypothetical protein
LAVNKALLERAEVELKYGMPPEVPVVVIPRVPEPVTGEPDVPKIEVAGTLNATDVTVPVPVGAAQVPSARRKLVVPPAEAGTKPCSDEVKRFSIAVTWAAVRSDGLAEPPVLLPLRVLAGMFDKNLFLICDKRFPFYLLRGNPIQGSFSISTGL